jgi:membrane associated rhomboid family serine protease
MEYTQEPTPIATITLVVITCLVSFAGFRDSSFESRLIFSPQRILAFKEGWRLITSGFLHANGAHLFFNMFSLYAFGRWIEPHFGYGPFLIIYFSSIVGGNLLALFLHRHHEYLAYGASGGVCGIIYAYIFLFPGSDIMFFLPIYMPAWLYAVLYLGMTFWALRRGKDNIGHDAHLGGAIVGLLVTTALYPDIMRHSPWLYAAVLGLSIGMLSLLIIHPLHLPGNSFELPYLQRSKPKPPPPPPRSEPTSDEVNRILDKISKSGMQSLTKSEHDTLQKASKKK